MPHEQELPRVTQNTLHQFKVGTAIRVHGLQSADQYNGECATIVIPYDSTTGRYGIKLFESGKKIAIRPSNVILLSKSEKKKEEEKLRNEEIEWNNTSEIRKEEQRKKREEEQRRGREE